MTYAIGFVIGLVLGLTGAGGSVIAVPLFLLLLGLPATDAMGLSLGVVLVATVIGVLLRIKQRCMQWRLGLYMAASGMLFAPMGRYLSQLIPEDVLVLCFTMLAIFLARKMWRSTNGSPSSLTTEPKKIPESNQASRYRLITCGGLFGLVSGLFGVGGGFLIVPVLTLYAGINMQQAIATSLLVIGLISAAGFTYQLVSLGTLPTHMILTTGTGASVGILLGTLFSNQLNATLLKRLFAIIVVALMSGTLIHTLN